MHIFSSKPSFPSAGGHGVSAGTLRLTMQKMNSAGATVALPAVGCLPVGQQSRSYSSSLRPEIAASNSAGKRKALAGRLAGMW
jgi:hypothetical protein